MFTKKIDINVFLSFILILFGIYVAYSRISNFSDGDSYSLIKAFLSLINEDTYSPSRGAYGHPIPEILIGSLSYFFGTKISNIFCFLLFTLSIIFFYKSFLNENKNVYLFILLILSNSFLLLENASSIDYPIALFFLSVGFYLLKSKKYLLSSIIFGITIASRVNFLIFIYPVLIIFFFYELRDKKIKNLIFSFLIITIVGLIFYYPLFNLHNFTLNFLEIPFIKENDNNSGWYGGPKMEFVSLFPRFVYKTYLLIGIFSVFIFLIFLKDLIYKIKFRDIDNLILIFIILINLFLFFLSPTKILLINPFIIVTYILIFKHFDKKKIYFLIIFNFIQWFAFYDIAEIKYKEKDICAAKQAIGYDFNFSLKKGVILEYLIDKNDMTECYSKNMGIYYDNFKSGKPLKLSE